MTGLTARGYADRAYLEKVTEAMTAFRRDDPLAGLYDAGDLNWWWRDGDYRDAANQMFWEDEQGRVLAFGLLESAYRAFDYEFLPSLGDAHEVVREMFRWGLGGLKQMAEGGEASLRAQRSNLPTSAPHADSDGFVAPSSLLAMIERERQEQDLKVSCSVSIRDSHGALRALAEKAGFALSGKAIVQTTLELPAPILLEPPAGYSVRSLRDDDLVDGGTPVLHQKAAALQKVKETPLYRRDLHLIVQVPDGRLAAECIVWLDAANNIGIFEPVRTHPDFYRRGLGKALLSEGLKLMCERGATLAKVAHDRDNPAAERLYTSLGFRKVFEKLEYTFTGEKL